MADVHYACPMPRTVSRTHLLDVFERLCMHCRHEGKFSKGRAHGPGVYVTHSGVELTGTWNENKRVGEFKKVMQDGARWTVKYADAQTIVLIL
jgi:hypothetical protein